MKLSKLLIALSLTFSISAFAQQKNPSEAIKEMFPETFFKQHPRLNFFKKPIFNKKDGEVLFVAYNKYAFEDLGINKKQYDEHITFFTDQIFEYLDDKEVQGPILVSITLKPYPPEKGVVCEETPTKCSMNSIEILLSKEYGKYNEDLSKTVLNKLNSVSESTKNPKENIGEPIISNFDYIGSMTTVIILNTTPSSKMDKEELRNIEKLKKELQSVIYPEGEETAKKYSELQKDYMQKNKDEIVSFREQKSSGEKTELSESERDSLEKKLDKEELAEEDKSIQEFNQLKQKLFPIENSKDYKS